MAGDDLTHQIGRAFEEAYGEISPSLTEESDPATEGVTAVATTQESNELPSRYPGHTDEVEQKIALGLHPSPLFDTAGAIKPRKPVQKKRPIADIPLVPDENRFVNPPLAAKLLGTTTAMLAQFRTRGIGPIYYRTQAGKAYRIKYRVGDLTDWQASTYTRVVPSGQPQK